MSTDLPRFGRRVATFVPPTRGSRSGAAAHILRLAMHAEIGPPDLPLVYAPRRRKLTWRQRRRWRPW